jgi:4-hydroxythreonine-4-phosphate dehydrogenase
METGIESSERPLLALTVGDPSGIGPEIALEVLLDGEVREHARLVVIGPHSLRPDGVPGMEDATDPVAPGTDVCWLSTEAPESWEMGCAQASCGRAALAALRAGAELASSARVDALVTGPVNKRALRMAGENAEGQTELLARWAAVERYEMIAVAGALRVMLLTRHLPLREAIGRLDPDAIVARLELFRETLVELGVVRPRLALAGLNPHAGESGTLGSEEVEILSPVAERLRADGFDVSGPISPDTVFLAASQGSFDGVLALYHDQAFIPLKLLSADRGVTLIAGLPYLRVSPVHGTAFDIAGRGIASSENLRQAVLQASSWARARAQRTR